MGAATAAGRDAGEDGVGTGRALTRVQGVEAAASAARGGASGENNSGASVLCALLPLIADSIGFNAGS